MRTQKKVKLQDIADEMHISIVTVSNALCGKKGVSSALREAVQKKASELGYEALHTAEVNKPHPYTIGVLFSSEDLLRKVQTFEEIVELYQKNIEREDSRSCVQELPSFHEILSRSFQPFAGQKIDGVLINGDIEPVYLKELKRKMNCPVVCTGYYNATSDIDFVITDDFHGMKIMTEYIVDSGFRDLYFIGDPKEDRRVMDRYLGFVCALEKREQKEQKRKKIPVFEGSSFATRFDLPEKLPEVFMCCNNRSALLLIKQLEDEGIRVPEDVSVTGFGFLHNDMKDGKRLTTYDFSHRLYAETAVNIMIHRLGDYKRPRDITMISGYIVEGDTLKKRPQS